MMGEESSQAKIRTAGRWIVIEDDDLSFGDRMAAFERP
jgi:hypothetical protein